MKNIITICTLFMAVNLSAQFYPMEAGGRGGLSSGFTFRAYVNEEISYESLLSFRNYGVQMHLFRQRNYELNMTEKGTWYFTYGFGPHIGFYYSDTYTVLFQEINYGGRVFSPMIGMNGYAGLEFRFFEIPISLGMSFKPYMELSYRQIFGFNIWDFGFTLKYRFKPENTYY